MSVRPLKAVPITYFRSHTKTCLHKVGSELEHLCLTYRGKSRACVIPMRDARVLWQLQCRPVNEMEDKLAKNYKMWLSAKKIDEKWGGVTLDESHWEYWAGFEKM